MAQQHAPGGHYSGHNPIPTVKQFVENLDSDKRNRDKQIDERAKAAKAQTGTASTAAGTAPSTPPRTSKKTPATTPKTPKTPAQDGVEDHKAQKKTVEGTEKTVTDPTTGREVVIADVNKDMIDEVEHPHLIVPNANLNKPTVSFALEIPLQVALTQAAH
jgi:hypothetical protein